MDLSKLTAQELKDLCKLQANIITKLESRNFWQRLKYLLTNR